MYLGQCIMDSRSKLDVMHDRDKLKRLEKLNKTMRGNLIEFKEKNIALEKFKKDQTSLLMESKRFMMLPTISSLKRMTLS